MTAASFNIQVNGFLDGNSQLVRPGAQQSAGLFPGSAQINRGQADYQIDAPVGLINLQSFLGTTLTYWLPFLDLTGPNVGLVDPGNTRIEILRSPGAASAIYTPGQGSVFAPFVITAGYVLRFEVRDAANALVPGPWNLYFTAIPLNDADDLCCLCDLAAQFGQQCDPPTLSDVQPSLVDANVLGPPPYSLTLFGSGFQPDDVVTIVPQVPAPPGIVSVNTIIDSQIDLDWTPVVGGVYDVTVTRAADPECASQTQTVTFVPVA